MEIACWTRPAAGCPSWPACRTFPPPRSRTKSATCCTLGYRHFVITPSFYIPARAATEHLRLFAAALEASGDMEMIGYNIPQVTGSVVAVETFCEAARRGWMRHCKESSGDLEYLRQLIEAGGEYGLRVLMGDERNAAAGLQAGAVGLVNVGINVEPATYLKLFAAAQRGDAAEMDRGQQRILTADRRSRRQRALFRGGAEVRAGAAGDWPRDARLAARTGRRGPTAAHRSVLR